MKEIIEAWNEYIIKESGMSRILQHMEEHDCVIITAFRDDPFDTSKCSKNFRDLSTSFHTAAANNTTEKKSVNKLRNRDLKSAILNNKDYGVTAVDGSFIERFGQPDQVEVREDSLLVVNLNDNPNFESDMFRLGEMFCQESILYIPKGTRSAYLYGTNNSEFPGYGNKHEIGTLKIGNESEFMTRINKKPFTFTESLQTYNNLSRLEKMAVRSIAKKLMG